VAAVDNLVIVRPLVAPDPLVMSAVKIVKILGVSTDSWEDAAHEAVREANETIDDIHGVEVESWTASVDDGEITEYKATVEVAFLIHNER
jgi:flavin-binding protein dodecin